MKRVPRAGSTMTRVDADQLHAWVQTLSRDDLARLWHWIHLEWQQRAAADPYRHAAPTPGGPAARGDGRG
jgi:hypothetical protein